MYSSYANNFDLSSETLDKYEKTEFYKAFKKVKNSFLGKASNSHLLSFLLGDSLWSLLRKSKNVKPNYGLC